MTSHKDEALRLLSKASAVADSLGNEFEREVIKLALRLAIGEVASIEELKRPRRVKKEVADG